MEQNNLKCREDVLRKKITGMGKSHAGVVL